MRMEWSSDQIIRLRILWDEGHSTAEVGRRLGVSKNAVVGKAHRLDLPMRPSPIHRNGSPTGRMPPRPIRRRDVPVLAPLACLAPPLPTVAEAPRVARAAVVHAPVMRVLPPPPKPYRRIVTCCWPIGEPGTRAFSYCEAPSTPGKPYCEEHCLLAFVRVRDRREEAA